MAKVHTKASVQTKASIKPVAGSQNRVVVEASAAEEKTKGGIIIPDTAKENLNVEK